ncbi:NUDIX hydrolase [Methyloradius palustris]|uniref:Phosphatase NudJ n=1 Tax=Methyloradius palustris TaxID=2778876 RepID=A0A8D5G9X8_9PROT|nr:NUDIX hydrolase [Methyloradius palustris]BCM25746.1 NUDIX hydrolase [Methyloradius palustris]
MIWKPNTTVAAVIEVDGKFLLVEEDTTDGIRLNQPAGHLEDGETLLQAVVREAQEESAYTVQPEALLGIYQWRLAEKDITYMRFAFIASIIAHDDKQKLDAGIIRAIWMDADEIKANQHRLRSPQVLKCVEDYLAGQRFPLSVITHIPH